MNKELKVFKDNIHGYIEVPKIFVSLLIDTPIFQRLRSIEQTSMRVLFPAARHDRFIHSLGTYYLGKKAYAALRRNINQRGEQTSFFDTRKKAKENDLFWDKYEILFHIACLMHDCAHAPFSHTFEYIYNLTNKLEYQLVHSIKNKEFASDLQRVNPKEHEMMSALIIDEHYRTAVLSIMEIYFPHHKWKRKIGHCMEFIARAITGTKYSTKNDREHQLLNCFISLLNSNIDVDGLDYIIRDSVLSGIESYSIDVDRLLGSINVVEVTDLERYTFSGNQLDNVICNAMFTGSLEGKVKGEFRSKTIEGKMSGYVAAEGNGCFTENIIRLGNAVGKVMISGNDYTNGKGDKKKEISVPKNNVQFLLDEKMNVVLASGSVTTTSNFNCELISSNISFSTVSLKINAKLTGEFSGRIIGKLDGHPATAVIAYHKSSLSVLENVVHARNYEYLWIYGHHKVAYYSNYLIKELLHKAAKIIVLNPDIKINFPMLANVTEPEGVLTSLLSIESFSNNLSELMSQYILPNDGDIMHLLKTVYFLNGVNGDPDKEFHDLYNELLTRKYRNSVWKSQSEFNILLSDISKDEKDALCKYLLKSAFPGRKYGCIPEDWKEEFDSFGLEDVIWVENSVTLKTIKPDDTFVLMKDVPVRFRDAALTTNDSDRDFSEYERTGFYLYYREGVLDKAKLGQIGELLMDKARQIFDENRGSGSQ